MQNVKKFIFSFIAIVIIPLAILLVIELGLRVSGVGTSYDYFFEVEINDRDYYQENREFANQFYPASLGIAPLLNTFSQERSPDVVRVYILGGSAAQGFPHVNHGLNRHLDAMLRATLPGKKIEIINTAMTSVNSHVVYEVAKGIPDGSADFAIILMGNNEVVGPYGPGTFNQNFTNSLTMIRALQTLKRTRLWQALAGVIEQARPDTEQQDLEWQGMQMFTDYDVTYDDPRLQSVYSHYENNLRDIIEILQDKDIHVLLSSVPVNLRNNAPFGSAQSDGLSEAELSDWSGLMSQGGVAANQGNWQAAISAFQAAILIDPDHADSHFRLATAYENLQDYATARKHYDKALDLDTLRFRSDTTVNQIIKTVADDLASDELTFVDNLTAFDNISAPYSPGWNLLHEHVHFDFPGNYVLAKEFSRAIVSELGMSNFEPLSSEEMGKWIGFPNHETNQVMNRLVNMVQKAPFTNASNFEELKTFTESRRDTIVSEVGSPQQALERRQEIVNKGHADWKLHFELAELNRFARNQDAMLFHLNELLKLNPHNHESQMKIAEAHSKKGNFSEAIYYLDQSLSYARGDKLKIARAKLHLGITHYRINEDDNGRDYLEQVIDENPDNISLTIQAYGNLVRFARERGLMSSAKSYAKDAERYARTLIAEGRDKEYRLLNRRIAQILTMAGEALAASKWQKAPPPSNK